MFQFPALAPASLPVTGLQPAGLSHSDIYGSNPVCGSPYLFAAYHVLLRLLKPRHPPSALVTFSFLSEFYIRVVSRLPRNCFPAISFKIAELSVAFFYLVIFPNIVNDLVLSGVIGLFRAPFLPKWAAKIRTFSLHPNLFGKIFQKIAKFLLFCRN